MGFDEGRSRGGKSALVGKRDIGRIPARTRADTVRVLQGGEEFMTQEWIAISPERIPLSRVELVDAVVELRSWRRLRQECFSVSRDSR
jgi:hypothetical protein